MESKYILRSGIWRLWELLFKFYLCFGIRWHYHFWHYFEKVFSEFHWNISQADRYAPCKVIQNFENPYRRYMWNTGSVEPIFCWHLLNLFWHTDTLLLRKYALRIFLRYSTNLTMYTVFSQLEVWKSFYWYLHISLCCTEYKSFVHLTIVSNTWN